MYVVRFEFKPTAVEDNNNRLVIASSIRDKSAYDGADAEVCAHWKRIVSAAGFDRAYINVSIYNYLQKYIYQA